MSKTQIAALVLLLGVSGCGSMLATIKTDETECTGFKMIHPTNSDVDVMSDSLVQQILDHNDHGVKTCGWKP